MANADCIESFKDCIRSHTGEWFARESDLPCPKEDLLAALFAAREESYRHDFASYRDVNGLIAELTLFVADEDYAVMAPFLAPNGRITSRPLGNPAAERARDGAYEVYQRLIAERLRIFPYLAATDGGLHTAIGAQREALHLSAPLGW